MRSPTKKRSFYSQTLCSLLLPPWGARRGLVSLFIPTVTTIGVKHNLCTITILLTQGHGRAHPPTVSRFPTHGQNKAGAEGARWALWHFARLLCWFISTHIFLEESQHEILARRTFFSCQNRLLFTEEPGPCATVRFRELSETTPRPCSTLCVTTHTSVSALAMLFCASKTEVSLCANLIKILRLLHSTPCCECCLVAILLSSSRGEQWPPHVAHVMRFSCCVSVVCKLHKSPFGRRRIVTHPLECQLTNVLNVLARDVVLSLLLSSIPPLLQLSPPPLSPSHVAICRC